MPEPSPAPSPLSVACPVCEAVPHEPCSHLSTVKTQLNFTHFVRRQIAARRPTPSEDN